MGRAFDPEIAQMTKPAAITGSLVDAYNVNAHKCMRLEIDVPVERAREVLAAFGWPTQVNPIPVAIARLEPETLREQLVASIEQERKGGPLAKAAGILCNEPAFWKFLQERHDVGVPISSAEDAADFIRMECQILSRAELDHHSEAAARFRDLRASYEAWSRM